MGILARATVPLLLAAMALADEPVSVDLSRGRQCFDERFKVRRFLNTVDSIKLGMPDFDEWTSARVMTALGLILMTERLDLAVDVRLVDGVDLFGLLRSAHADVILEIWPALMEEARYNATIDICGFSPCVTLAGLTGFTGRSGWFVAHETIDITAEWNTKCSGPCLLPRRWKYSNVFEELSLENVLITADELPITDICADFPSWAAGSEFGDFDCKLGQFVPRDPHCCPRGQTCVDESGDEVGVEVLGIGNITKKPCRALLVPSPSYDAGFNERSISKMAYRNFQIVYGNVSAGIELSRREQRPLVFYWWEPHVLLLPVGSFVRIASVSFLHCTAGESVSWRGGDAICDFPEQAVEKAYNYKMTAVPKVVNLVSRLSVNYRQVMEMLVSQDANDDDPWLAACEWLRENPDQWSSWVQPGSEYLGSLIFALVAASTIFAYVFIVEPCEGAISRWFGRKPVLGPTHPADTRNDEYNEAQAELDDEMALRLTKGVVAGPGDLHITFGQETVIARETDTWASLVILRLGDDIADELRVNIEAINGTAKFGRDYGEVVPIVQGQETESLAADGQRRKVPASRTAEAPGADDAQMKEIVFGKGERTSMVHVRLLQSPGYDSMLTFFLNLRLPAESRAFVGPIAKTKVKIVNVDAYPNGYKFDVSTQQGSRYYASLQSDAVIVTEDDDSTTPLKGQASENQSDDYIGYCQRLRRTYLQHRERWRVIGNFLAEAHRGNMKQSVKHSVAQFIIAAIDNFAAPILKAIMINEGLGDGNNNAALFSALMMVGLEILRWRLLRVFAAGWPVLKRLQRILVRKFFSLHDMDLILNPTFASQYRAAILQGSVGLTFQGYVGLHGVIAGVYQILFIAAYLIYQGQNTTGDRATVQLVYAIVFPVGFLLLLCLQLYRGGRTWELWRRVRNGEISMYDAVAFALSHRELVQESEKEDDAMFKLEAGISKSLESNFGLWLYNHFTASWARGLLLLATYMLWATGPYITDPSSPTMNIGDFIVLLDVLALLSTAVLGLQERAVEMYTCGSIVIEISALLNYPTHYERTLLLTSKSESLAADEHHETHSPVPSRTPEAKTRAKVATKTSKRKPPNGYVAGVGRWPASNRNLLRKLDSLVKRQVSDIKANEEVRYTRQSNSRARSRAPMDGTEAERPEPLAKTPAEDPWLEEVRSIIASVEAANYAFKVKDVFLKLKRRAPTFAGLQLIEYPSAAAAAEGAVPRPVDLIPAGCIIGLRTSAEEGEFSHMAEVSLMRMFAGRLKPQKGVATTMPALKAGFIGDKPELFEGNLLENLLYGVVPSSFIQDGVLVETSYSSLEGTDKGGSAAVAVPIDDAPSEELIINDYQLWKLCKRVGLNEAIIGKKYAENSAWAQMQIDPSSATGLLSLDDQRLVALVRTLLRSPDILILHRTSGIADLNGHRQIVSVARDFLNHSLDKLTHPRLSKKRLHRRRTVLLAAPDGVLCSALKADEIVLTLESPSQAVIKSRAQTFTSKATKEWQALWMQELTPKDKGNASSLVKHRFHFASSRPPPSALAGDTSGGAVLQDDDGTETLDNPPLGEEAGEADDSGLSRLVEGDVESSEAAVMAAVFEDQPALPESDEGGALAARSEVTEGHESGVARSSV